jgi:hypothetical protein
MIAFWAGTAPDSAASIASRAVPVPFFLPHFGVTG